MTDTHPTRIDHILLFCANPLVSRSFYRDVLGFEIAQEDGEVTHLRLGETRLMLYPIGGDKGWLADEPTLGRGVRFYFDVPDVDALCDRVKAKVPRIYNFDDFKPISGPIIQPWGVREFGVSDPDGYRLTFVTRVIKQT
ncbi:MAG: VOC family protein [Chloroflexi bacterium]|nr:VOC family protein [Chloroflexota bacterium]